LCGRRAAEPRFVSPQIVNAEWDHRVIAAMSRGGSSLAGSWWRDHAGCAPRSVGSPATTCGASRGGRRRDARRERSVWRQDRGICGGWRDGRAANSRVRRGFGRWQPPCGAGSRGSVRSGARGAAPVQRRCAVVLGPGRKYRGSRQRSNPGCCSHGDRGIVIRRTFSAVAVQQNPVSVASSVILFV
jgi:hypothetical protein